MNITAHKLCKIYKSKKILKGMVETKPYYFPEGYREIYWRNLQSYLSDIHNCRDISNLTQPRESNNRPWHGHRESQDKFKNDQPQKQ